jgi:hypothetical protein
VKFALALLIAVHFWSDRGVHVPCHPVAVSGADTIMGKDVWGYPNAMEAAPGCRILISSIVPVTRYWDPEYYCAFVTHEVGHLSGLGHTERGIMAAGQLYDDEVPWDCAHWRQFARRNGIAVRNARRTN